MDALERFLRKLGLEQYVKVLAENDVDLEVLPHVSDEDLKELGFSIGHRRKLLAALRDAPPAQEIKLLEGETARENGKPTQEQADRRQLTVLFCDLSGSTELSQQLDPEELRDVMRRYHDAVAEAVTTHEGHVAKFLGDGVLAYFGWPHAREAQSEMAVRAALAATRAVGRIEAAGKALAARAGLATGPVVVGDLMGRTAHERGAVVGAVPSLASRLQDVAKSGQVVIDEMTKRVVGASFELEEGGKANLKGFATPMPFWRVKGAVRASSRFEALHGSSLTQFVGRGHELGLLEDRWAQAKIGEGQVVLIAGEAGIGKSRILREFMASLEGVEQTTLRYQCSPHDVNAAFHPVIAEVETSAGFLVDDSIEVRLDKLERHLEDVLGDVTIAAPLIAGLLMLPVDRYPSLEMGPQRRRQRTIEFLTERVARLAAKRPLIMLIEDIHWIDASSLELIDAIVDRMEALPILVVMTHRPEFGSRWNGYGHVTFHSLNRLSRNDGKAMAERIAGGNVLPDQVLTRILEQTDGIPLFVEELTKTVLEGDILEEKDGHYVLKGPLPSLAIPSTLQDSLMARLDRLTPVKKVIQAAACIGREFSAGLLAQALPMDRRDLDEALDQLLSAQLIFRRTSAEDARFIFKHALVQDAAYSSLLVSARRTLHERLAKALERSEDPDPLELARHFHEAGLQEQAARSYLAAGRHSIGESALPEAIGALELGLQAAEALASSEKRDRLSLDLQIALGTARMASFGWAHASVAQALEPAFPHARKLGDEDALVSILWGLWVHYQTRTDFARAHEWLSELETVARERPESDLPVVYDMSAGCQHFWEADHERAIRHTERLKGVYERNRHARIARFTNHDPLVFSQHWAGSMADWLRGYPERSTERMEEAVALARDIGHPFNLVFALTAGASVLIYLGEANWLLRYCDEAESVAREEALGRFSETVNVTQWRGGALVQRGDYEEGYALAKQGNDFWNMSGGRICNAMFRGWIVEGLEGLGRLDDALALNERNIMHCRQTGDCYMEPECLRKQGELTLKAGGDGGSETEALFREALRLARSQEARSWELRAATSLARYLKSREKSREGVAVLEPVYGWFSEGLQSRDLCRARDLLDEL
jgi:class 3 adenylate cyclase